MRGVFSDRVPGHVSEAYSCGKQKIWFVFVVATLEAHRGRFVITFGIEQCAK